MNNNRLKNKVIRHLISKYDNSKTNIVSINIEDVKKMKLQERQVVRMLYTLDSSNLIIIHQKSHNHCFDIYWTIEILLPYLDYFHNKTIDRRRFAIPVLISIIGALASIATAYFTALSILTPIMLK